MAGTQINQNQINLGSETAIDLLAMQNGWKRDMITAMNNKISGYASDADTMSTIVSKFMALTGNTPDTVYKVFKSYSGNGVVAPIMSAMPTTSNDSWEIRICKKCYDENVLVGDPYAEGGIELSINYGNAESGYITARVPVYKEDESGDLEKLSLNDNDNYDAVKFAFTQGTKYWIKLGYGDGKYYCKVSTDGDSYDTTFEITSARKTQCAGHYDTPDTPYLDIRVGSSNGSSLDSDIYKDTLFLKECKVKIDGNTIFNGDGNIIMGTDVTWRDGAVHLADIIQL